MKNVICVVWTRTVCVGVSWRYTASVNVLCFFCCCGSGRNCSLCVNVWCESTMKVGMSVKSCFVFCRATWDYPESVLHHFAPPAKQVNCNAAESVVFGFIGDYPNAL
jgi:hypothetical protein